MIEAITTELESYQIDVVELTLPTTSSKSHPTTVYLSEGRSEQLSGEKSLNHPPKLFHPGRFNSALRFVRHNSTHRVYPPNQLRQRQHQLYLIQTG